MVWKVVYAAPGDATRAIVVAMAKRAYEVGIGSLAAILASALAAAVHAGSAFRAQAPPSSRAAHVRVGIAVYHDDAAFLYVAAPAFAMTRDSLDQFRDQYQPGCRPDVFAYVCVIKRDLAGSLLPARVALKQTRRDPLG